MKCQRTASMTVALVRGLSGDGPYTEDDLGLAVFEALVLWARELPQTPVRAIALADALISTFDAKTKRDRAAFAEAERQIATHDTRKAMLQQ